MFDAEFLKGETWGFPGAAVEHIETHAAHVFLAGPRAFKIKKDVKLPYLDFSSREKRQQALAAELEINRIFSGDIYLGLMEVRGEPVLVMRRFAGGALLSWQMAHGGIDAGLAGKLAAMAAHSHDRAPRRDTPGAGIMTGLGAQLSGAFVDSPDIFRPAETIEFHAAYRAALQTGKALLNARSERGLVRRCHGDMHAGNIIVEAGEPKLFDAIEFSEKIATIDVLYDLAFLVMDLWTNAERRAANLVLNRYLHLRRNAEDLSGLTALPLFLATRAGVRALVSADLAHEQQMRDSLQARGQALDWFRAALAYLRPAAPLLVAIGGLSGTGKSTAAAALAPGIGLAPGAIHVRSDIERKVLAGVSETERLGAAHYSRDASFAVYDACLARAEAALRAGQAAVLDAVFAAPHERRAAEDLARRVGVRFEGLWLEAPEALLKSRVESRHGDASDATPQVVDRQLGYDLGQIGWRRIDAGGSASETVARISALLTP
ncbi:MAG: AAA family ATPase [Aestuariivirga sp.]|uniref:bifunctional aminoglycoside phosphotransferase/ATP-binding protein n=1 Tax=Aestuariivirga sp. TaxID=2650926 RepID=UPI0038CFD9C1